jgi:alpha-D-xyloside xylohydrolase
MSAHLETSGETWPHLAIEHGVPTVVKLLQKGDSTSGALAVARVVVGGTDGWVALPRPHRTSTGDPASANWRSGASLELSSVDQLTFVTLNAPGVLRVGIATDLRSDEAVFGLGERFDRINQRGSFRRLWVENGSYGDKAYKPVPVVLTSAGYGIAVETTRAVTVSAGSEVAPDRCILLVDGESCKLVVFTGSGLAELVEQYTEWVGRPEVPPRWFFLPWKMGDWNSDNQNTVVDDLRKQEELGIRWGAKVIDAGWETETHDFVFDQHKYPDPTAMLTIAESLEVPMLLWVSPSITAGTKAHAEAAAKDILVTDADGRAYIHDLGNHPGWQGSAIDFTSERAVRWWQEKIHRLLEAGVRGFKTDFGEQLPDDCFMADGRRGFEVHNDYPRLYNEATWGVVGPAGGVLVARSAWQGSQSISAIWAGDQSSDFSPWAGLPSVIVAGQTAGLCGFPYWGSDIGGYFGNPTEECFIRWIQLAAFSPLMELHGLGVREPWAMGEEILQVFLRYARLHAGLQEYSELAAQEARRTGMPIMRAMALVDPSRRHPDWVDYQYGYGPELLVAPVYAATRTRHIYLPSGGWWSALEKSWRSGPIEIDLEVPLDAIPVFVKAGAIVPYLPAARLGELELHLFPSPGVSRELTLLDGSIVSALTGDGGETAIEVAGLTREVAIMVHCEVGSQMSLVESGGATLDGQGILRFRSGSSRVIVEVRHAR